MKSSFISADTALYRRTIKWLAFCYFEITGSKRRYQYQKAAFYVMVTDVLATFENRCEKFLCVEIRLSCSAGSLWDAF